MVWVCWVRGRACRTLVLAAPARATLTVTGCTSAELANARIFSGIVAENIAVWRWPVKNEMISLRSSSKPVSTCTHEPVYIAGRRDECPWTPGYAMGASCRPLWAPPHAAWQLPP